MGGWETVEFYFSTQSSSITRKTLSASAGVFFFYQHFWSFLNMIIQIICNGQTLHFYTE